MQGVTGPVWPDFGRTTTLNLAAYCALANVIPPSQRMYEPVGVATETIYGSDGQGHRQGKALTIETRPQDVEMDGVPAGDKADCLGSHRK
jgi:hypothetical protein